MVEEYCHVEGGGEVAVALLPAVFPIGIPVEGLISFT